MYFGLQAEVVFQLISPLLHRINPWGRTGFVYQSFCTQAHCSTKMHAALRPHSVAIAPPIH